MHRQLCQRANDLRRSELDLWGRVASLLHKPDRLLAKNRTTHLFPTLEIEHLRRSTIGAMKNAKYHNLSGALAMFSYPYQNLGVLTRVVAFAALVLQGAVSAAAGTGMNGTTVNASPPSKTVKLIFIHHSTGQNWLTDGYGNLGQALGQNNYFVSDTNYGWGPNSIGDRTDIPNWTEWFSSPDTATYMTALFADSDLRSSYTRPLADPGGDNEIVMFKSCFPNSNLEGTPTDPPSAAGWLTVGHAKYVYNEILKYFATRPDKLFVVITAPPLQDGTYAINARAFNQWLMNNWLSENNYLQRNVAIFDFYNVLTGPDNHHRVVNTAIEHTFVSGTNTLYYPSGDDHPSVAGSQKASTEFVPLLNAFYNNWRACRGRVDAHGECQRPKISPVIMLLLD